MNNDLKIILEKLDQIEKRIKKLEGSEEELPEKNSPAKLQTKERDPYFERAWQIILQSESDLSSSELAKRLNVDLTRAEAIMDQLQEAGLGMVYEKEV